MNLEVLSAIAPDAVMGRLLRTGRRLDRKDLIDGFREPQISFLGGRDQKEVLSSCDGSAAVALGKTSVIAGVIAEVGFVGSHPIEEETGVSEARAKVGEVVISVDAGKTSSLAAKVTATVHLGPLPRPGSLPGRESGEAKDLSFWLNNLMSSNPLVARDKLDVELVSSREGGNDVDPPALAWSLSVHIYALSMDGNLRDACLLATNAALQSTRLPRVSLENGVVIAEPTPPEPLVVGAFLASMTFAAIDDFIIADPTAAEEAVTQGTLVVVVDGDGQLCSLTKRGLCPAFTQARVRECILAAQARAQRLRTAVTSHDD